MKFILNEKYILNESEDLTEASNQDLIDNLNNAIEQALPDLKNNLTIFADKIKVSKKSSDKNDAYNAVISAVQEIENTRNLANGYDINKLIPELSVFKQKFEVFLKKADINNITNGDTNKVKNALKNLNDKININPPTTRSVKDALKNFDILSASINQVNASNTFEADNKKIEDLKATLQDIANIINNDVLTKQVSLDNFDQANINDYTKALKNSYDTIKTFNTKVNGNANLNNQTTNSIINSGLLSNMLNNFQAIKNTSIRQAQDSSDEKAKEAQKIADEKAIANWSELLDKAGADGKKRAEIWDRYFKAVWGNKANTVKELGTNFTSTLIDLGFSEVQNPYVKYLKLAFEKNLNVTYDSFRIIRGGAAEYLIGYSDLKQGQGGRGCQGKLGKYNIIFLPQFYAESPRDMIKYLKLQFELVDNAEKIITNRPELKDSYSLDNKGIQELFRDIFFEPGNVLSKKSGNFELPLKDTSTVNLELSNLYTRSNQKKTLLDNDPALVSTFKDKPDPARAAIYYLWSTFADADFSALQKYGITDKVPSGKNISSLKQFFKRFDISNKNVNSIINQIATIGGVINNAENSNE